MMNLWFLFLARRFFPTIPLWIFKGYKVPYPARVKQLFLLEKGYKDATWIETGTYLGETTQALAKKSKFVYSIEPQIEIFRFAQTRIGHLSNVKIINGTSKNILTHILPLLSGNVNFYLDGHYSGGKTFNSGEAPVLDELALIDQFLPKEANYKIFIDDFRLFRSENVGDDLYPRREALVEWAKDRKLDWSVEKDIFCIWNENRR